MNMKLLTSPVHNKEFTIGTDPEFFVVNERGHLKSAIPFIHGTKHEPEMLPNGAGLQVDNVAVEFAAPVSHSLAEFMRSIATSVYHTKRQLPYGYNLAFNISSAIFPEEELQHPNAHVFGCSPDWDAWRGEVNMMPDTDGVSLRSCGGHIHVGNKLVAKTDINRRLMVKIMDCLHGVISGVLDDNQGSKKRRELYGKPGCFRATEYGIEYRTLSNYWLKNTSTIKLMYSLTDDAIFILRTSTFNQLLKGLGGKKAIHKAIIHGPTTKQSETLMQYMSNDSLKYYREALDKMLNS